MSDLKQAVERLEEQAKHHESQASHYDLIGNNALMAGLQARKARDLRLVLSALSKAEAERDLLESRLAALRPLVRAAVECMNADLDLSGRTRMPLDALLHETQRLTPSDIAWAKGGE